jgi:hypothetical protein
MTEEFKCASRSPRTGELFRVHPEGGHAETILMDAPAKGVMTELGYTLVAKDFAPTAWANPAIVPHLKRVVMYLCQNQEGENSFG